MGIERMGAERLDRIDATAGLFNRAISRSADMIDVVPVPTDQRVVVLAAIENIRP